MTKLEVRSYQEPDQEAIVQLWRDCGVVVPWNDPVEDIQRRLSIQREMFLVGLLGGQVVAAIMAGYEGHRGWLNYLAVAPDHRNRGFGRDMMAEAEARLKALGCPKINLQVRNSNTGVIEFCRGIGFSIDDVTSMGKRLDG